MNALLGQRRLGPLKEKSSLEEPEKEPEFKKWNVITIQKKINLIITCDLP